MSGSALRAERARLVDALFAVGLFATSFALRLRVALSLAAEPVWDGHYYDYGARRIAEGQGYSDDIAINAVPRWHPWCHYPVGYSAYLAAFYRVLGEHPWVPHVADALTGALLAVVSFLLAREALSPARARLSGVLVALHPGLVLYAALEMSEPLSALLVLAAFWVAVRYGKATPAREAGSLRGPALGGLLLGLAALVRPQALLCAPVLALAVPGGLARRGAALALACGLSLAPVLPWTARNCRVMDGCALVSTNAGWNLAIGAFPRATGRFETLHASDGCREVTGQVQQDRCWLAYGVAHIEADPWRWLSLVPKKLSFTFDHESFAVEYLHEARPAAWPEERRTAIRSAITTAHRLLVLASSLAFVGLALGRRAARDRAAVITQGALLAAVALSAAFMFDATPTVWPLVVAGCLLPLLPLPGRPARSPMFAMLITLVGTTVVVHAVFFGEDRYHVALTPALCILAAAALRAPESRRLEARGRPEMTESGGSC